MARVVEKNVLFHCDNVVWLASAVRALYVIHESPAANAM